jgi:hypothetical protein
MNHTHPQEQKGGPFTQWLDFSLVAWKFYFLKLAATIFGLDYLTALPKNTLQ